PSTSLYTDVTFAAELQSGIALAKSELFRHQSAYIFRANEQEYLMRRVVSAIAMVLLMDAAAGAQQTATTNDKVLKSLPGDAVTITDYYRQNVYDASDKKIGEIMDVLVDKTGHIKAFMVGVGGFLGAGEKDVAVPFDAVKVTTKDDKTYLVMNANKDELKNALGFKYDSSSTKWVAENK